MLDLLKISGGLILLFYGGDFLVTGSVRLARFLKVSSFAIGATVIAFGTSAPELAVAILGALNGAPELAMGNVIGSNIANIGLVLGLTTLVGPIAISKDRFKRGFPPLFITTIIIILFSWDLKVFRYEGIILLVLLPLYLWRSFSNKDNLESEIKEFDPLKDKKLFNHFTLTFVGLIGLIGGAKLLVSGGVAFARMIGISEWFIGITIVAIGTSLPEIVSSIIAARRGHSEMAIGNVFGSNILNILMVLGVTCVLKPLHIKEPIHPDLFIVVGITIILLILILFEKYLLRRLSGAILLTTYGLYIVLKGLEFI